MAQHRLPSEAIDLISDITAETPFATPRICGIIERKCYVSKGKKLDDVDFTDPGILADIRAAFAVLAQIEVEGDQG